MLLLKLFGSISVLGASSFLGYMLARDYIKRPQQLREIQSMLQILENEIAFISNMLKDALYKAGTGTKSPVGFFFREASVILAGGYTDASDAWTRAVTENIDKTSLNQEDAEILLSFGKMLGSSDYEGQIRNIRLISSQLHIQEQKAEELRKKNESMYRNLGVLGGLAIVIILI